MPAARNGVLRPVLILLLAVAGVLVASGLGGDLRESAPPAAAARPVTTAELQLQFGRNQLDLRATTASPAHAAALYDLLAEQYADTQIETDFRDGLLLPPDWETLTTRLLYVVAATTSANVTASEQHLSILATTADLPDYEARLAFLKSALGGETQLESEVISVGADVTTQDLCARNFAAITAPTNGTRQALRFRQASVSLGESADALLDKLAEFAFDCQSARIAIQGHTDSTGAESWNVLVSEARAQAVAEQLMERGIAANRLIVEGHGSKSPLGDNGTVQGRAQNRRIEFELR